MQRLLTPQQMSHMNKPKITIITPVYEALNKHQLANLYALQLQGKRDWEIVFTSWSQEGQLNPFSGLGTQPQVVLLNSGKTNAADAINEAYKVAKADYLTVIDPFTVLGLDFVSSCYSVLSSPHSNNMVAVPKVLVSEGKPVREIGFKHEKIKPSDIQYLYGDLTMVGRREGYPKFKQGYYSFIHHMMRCVFQAEGQVPVVSPKLTCSIQEFNGVEIGQEYAACNEFIASAFSLGFNIPQTLAAIQIFAKRKALLIEFIDRFGRFFLLLALLMSSYKKN